MINEMERTINKNLLKYAVGHAIFCPGKHCGGAVMDMRRAVMVTVKRGGQELRTLTICAACFDASRAELNAAVEGKGCTLELVDGRELFAKRKAPAKAAGRPLVRAADEARAKSKVDVDAVMAAVEADENTGFCTACGHEQDGCEPDARRYTCEACGAAAVYGAQELLLIMGA
jgi:hypothetical protein